MAIHDGAPASVDLARVAGFRLGPMQVDPPTRQVFVGNTAQTLEPRVMQVLVVLAGAGGAVVSRDDLIARCWDGRIVSEAAINRVISRLRQLATETQAFRIETITKVGYRLSGEPEPEGNGFSLSENVAGPVADAGDALLPPMAEDSGSGTRRSLLVAGGLVGGATVAGGLWWVATAGSRARRREVEQLIARARAVTWMEGVSDGDFQAIAYLRQATALDPDSAEAWGALAIALFFANSLRADISDPAAHSARVESAAKRALEIDPGNADALVARAVDPPIFRHWTAREAEFRPLLERFPDHEVLRWRYGTLLAQVGLHSEAVMMLSPLVKAVPNFAYGRQLHAISLWSAGRIEEAEQQIDQAFRTWPMVFWIWILRFNFLALSGRPKEALAQAEAPETRPTFPWPAEISLASARALASREPAAVAEAVAIHADHERRGRLPHFISTQYLAALGALDAAFALAADALLGPRPAPGAARVPRSPWADVTTAHLFMPATRPMREDPRLQPLLEVVGLERFWRETGRVPDFRKRGG